MFFFMSKVLWYLLVPVHLLLLGAFLGACTTAKRFARGGRRLSIACSAILILIGVFPGATLLIRPLEDRFPLPPDDMPPPAGIIVLGGAINDDIGEARRQVTFGEGAGRLTEAAILAKRYPDAKIVFTGGSNSLISSDSAEGEHSKRLFVALGIEPERILLETRSRNTDENARFTRDMVQPKPGEVWLLVTSAYHMPRSMGLFRHSGFNVVAYPVDYHTFGDDRDWELLREAPAGLRLFDIAAHEWIGLAAYRLAGKIDEWFPGP
jgi:uncharacterized SAM-binding protein YcdF (DUF218 family)